MERHKKNAEYTMHLVDAALSNQLESELPGTHVKKFSRIKSAESIQGKVDKKRAEGKADYGENDLTDIVGFRLVCHFQPDITKVVRMLLGMIGPQGLFSELAEPALFYTVDAPTVSTLRAAIENVFSSFNDPKITFEERAKESRYTSIHLVCKVALAKDFPVEIQIRNVFEDAWASIEHATNYKGRPVAPSVKRHLTVLMSLVQACVEYAEAIRLDMGDAGGDQTASITSLVSYAEDIKDLPTLVREKFAWIMQQRAAEKHTEILEEVGAILRSDDRDYAGDARYFLRMEEALSYLMLNNVGAAQTIYENVATDYPKRAMVPFRMCDVFKLKNDYARALKAAQSAADLLKSDPAGSFAQERKFISTYLPLKKAYYYWRQGDPAQAHAELAPAYAKFDDNTDELLRRKFFSSLVYYALEMALNKGAVDQKLFNGYLERMRGFKMQSIETALPQEVDTYALVCHHVGLEEEARRAIMEVFSCIEAKDPTLGPMFVHKGTHTGMTLAELDILHEHIRLIMANKPKLSG